MSIRTKLIIIFFAFVFLPTAIVLTVLFSNARDVLMETVKGRLEIIADMKKDKIEDFFTERMKDLKAFQGINVIRKDLPIVTGYPGDTGNPRYAEAHKELDARVKILQDIYGYDDVMLTDTRGKIVYASNDSHASRHIGKPLPDPGNRAYEKGKTGAYLGDAFKNPLNNNRINMFASGPLYGKDGRFIGVIALSMDMVPVYKTIQATEGLMKTGETQVGKITGDRILLLNPIRTDPDAALKRTIVIGGKTGVPMQNAARGESGSGLSTDYRNEDVVAAWRYIPSLGWGVVAKIDADEAFAPVIGLRNFTVFMGIVALFSGLAAAFLISKTISDPISALHNGAEIIGAGNLEVKVGTRAKDEIGGLSRAFDRMAENLRKTTASRDELDAEVAERRKAEDRAHRLNRLYSVLSEVNQMIIRIRDRQKILDSACRIAVEFGGFTMAWAGFVDAKTDMVKPEAYWGHVDGYLDNLHLSIDAPDCPGPTATAIVTGRHFICPDIESDPAMLPWREEALKRGYRSSAAFPISIGNIVTGAFMVYSSEKEMFDKDEVRLLDELAADISFGLEFSRQEEERKKAEEELRLAGAYNRCLIEASLDPLVTISPDGRITDVNSATEKVTGFARNELVGKDFSDFFTEPGRARAGYELVFREGIVKDYELEVLHKDGYSTPVLYNASVYRDEKGQVAGVFAAARDITERKRAEKAVREMNEELERRVVERTAQLAVANKELEAFCYSVSHDLRSPLRSIDGFSQALLEDYSARLDDIGKDFLCRVRAASQRMAQLIDDLLKLSRVTRSEISRERVDLTDLCRSVAVGLKACQPERDVEFVIQEGLTTEGDPHLMRVVLENLIGNAWKFTSKHERARIEVGATEAGGRAAFYVKDDGSGFDMAYVKKLFGPFQRLHAATEFPGTGIGLATVQRIVAKHGGKVWAEGELDKGATFYFTLELAEQDKSGEQMDFKEAA